ncbi:MAG: hypothetical protein ACRC7O_05105, partial [Fimbriiglobus sp.]
MPPPTTFPTAAKVGLWKPPARQMTAARSVAAASSAEGTVSQPLSVRLLPEHFADLALPAFLNRAKGLVLVAEGDSWFDYPAPFRIDLIDELKTLGREIVSLAYRGDTLENMVYGTGGTDGDLVDPDLTRLAVLTSELKPKAVLYSAGGNDVVGA